MLGFPWMHTPIPQISWAKKEITHWFKHCLTHCLQVLKLLAASPSVESPEPCSTVEIPFEYEHLANGIGEGFVFVFLFFLNTRFIWDFSSIAIHFTPLLKKRLKKLQWNTAAEHTFAQFKEAFTTAPSGNILTPSNHFIIQTDATDTGVVAVLSQTLERNLSSILWHSSPKNVTCKVQLWHW